MTFHSPTGPSSSISKEQRDRTLSGQTPEPAAQRTCPGRHPFATPGCSPQRLPKKHSSRQNSTAKQTTADTTLAPLASCEGPNFSGATRTLLRLPSSSVTVNLRTISHTSMLLSMSSRSHVEVCTVSSKFCEATITHQNLCHRTKSNHISQTLGLRRNIDAIITQRYIRALSCFVSI